MSWTHLRTEYIKKSIKDYHCDGCHLFHNYGSTEQVKMELSSEELIEFERMEVNDFKIKKGNAYMKVIGISDGDFCISRFDETIYKMAEKHDMFDE
jgi:hypothetical protein